TQESGDLGALGGAPTSVSTLGSVPGSIFQLGYRLAVQLYQSHLSAPPQTGRRRPPSQTDQEISTLAHPSAAKARNDSFTNPPSRVPARRRPDPHLVTELSPFDIRLSKADISQHSRSFDTYWPRSTKRPTRRPAHVHTMPAIRAIPCCWCFDEILR
ncbi:6337_t:CDS:2, partial [Scutellospora calospora]